MLKTLLIYTEIVFYMIPMSLIFSIGVQAHLLPFLMAKWEHSYTPAGADIIYLGWWLLALKGFLSLWHLFLNYQHYTVETVPPALKAHLCLGGLALIPLYFILGQPLFCWQTVYYIGLPVSLLIQFYVLIQHNRPTENTPWDLELYMQLLRKPAPLTHKKRSF